MTSRDELNFALRRLVKSHSVPLAKLPKKLDISPQECLHWWANQKATLPTSKIRNLTSLIGVSEDDLAHNLIQPATIETGILDFEDRLNPRYADHAFSKVFSSKHIVELIALRYGTRVAHGILYKLGVHPNYFRDTKKRINLLFFEDLLKEYLTLGNTYNDIPGLSEFLFLTTEEDQASKSLFPICTSYVDAFRHIYDSLTTFEENFDYEFQISSNHVRIISRPSEKLAESMKDTNFGSRELYRYRSSTFGNFVALCGLPTLKTKILKCNGQGDPYSVYELEYPSCRFVSNI